MRELIPYFCVLSYREFYGEMMRKYERKAKLKGIHEIYQSRGKMNQVIQVVKIYNVCEE